MQEIATQLRSFQAKKAVIVSGLDVSSCTVHVFRVESLATLLFVLALDA
jgi:hypothetical protein